MLIDKEIQGIDWFGEGGVIAGPRLALTAEEVTRPKEG